MTNYLQIIAAALAFNLNFPSYLSGILTDAQRVGQASGIFLSFDCLLLNTNAVDTFDNITYLKVIWIAIAPVILILFSTALFGIRFLKDRVKFLRYLCVSVITIFFVLHPTLTQYCLRIFKCVHIGDNRNQVEMDIATGCWSVKHIKWIFSLGKHIYNITLYSYPNVCNIRYRDTTLSIYNLIQKQK